jgi:ABC-type microcin C transport system permease subunit YejB
MAHYGWYNLSPQGKVLSSASFQVIGFALEAFVFCYLGLSFFSYAGFYWSWSLIGIEFLSTKKHQTDSRRNQRGVVENEYVGERHARDS